MTKTQRAVLAALTDTNRFLSAQDVHAMLRAQGSRAGLSSVYRALHALEGIGEVDAVQAPAGETTYRRCRDEAHHHHLICSDCGATVEVEAAAIEQWAKRTATQHGFVLDTHTVELHGRCAGCAGR